MACPIVYFTDSNSFGGTEQLMLNTLAQLDRRLWQPSLVHYRSPELGPLLEGARRIGLNVRVLPRLERPAERVAQMTHVLRTARPAIFHAHLNWPLACRYELLAAIMARVPAIVATEHLFKDIPWRRSRLVQRAIGIGVDRYIAVSCHVAQLLEDQLRLPARKIRVIRNGIPLARFGRPAPAGLRASIVGASDRRLILTIARLDAQKGQRYLLEAAATIPEVVVGLAGEGPDRVLLEQMARDLGRQDRVVFLGQRADIPDLLACCDLFVLPSLFEGLPLAVLEAMAAGKPVIAAAVGGTAEAIIDRVSGLLVPPADPAALSGAIRALLDNPVLAEKLAMAGQERVRAEFSAEIMARRVTALYDEVLASKHE